MSRSQRRLVLIDWIDSHSSHQGWNPIEELEESTAPLPCRSVGWIVSRANGVTTIVPHISGGDDLKEFGRGELTIPDLAIVKITDLKAGK